MKKSTASFHANKNQVKNPGEEETPEAQQWGSSDRGAMSNPRPRPDTAQGAAGIRPLVSRRVTIPVPSKLIYSFTNSN